MDYKSNKPGFTDTDIWYNNTTNWTTKHHIAYYMVSVNALEAKSRHDANFVGPCDIGAAIDDKVGIVTTIWFNVFSTTSVLYNEIQWHYLKSIPVLTRPSDAQMRL